MLITYTVKEYSGEKTSYTFSVNGNLYLINTGDVFCFGDIRSSLSEAAEKEYMADIKVLVKFLEHMEDCAYDYVCGTIRVVSIKCR